MEPEAFGTPEVARLLQVTVGKLDNWHRGGLLSPSIASTPGHGVSRLYTFPDVVALRAAIELTAAGVSLRMVRLVVAHVRSRPGLSSRASLAPTLLVVDHRGVHEFGGDVNISALRQDGQRFLCVLSLSDLVGEVQAKLAHHASSHAA